MENNTHTKESKMKTQKQLKLIAIESFAHSLNNLDITVNESINVTTEEAAEINKFTAEFKANILERFSGSASKRAGKLAAKHAEKLVKNQAKQAKLEAKAAKKQEAAAKKLERDTNRAAKLAAKLEKLQPKTPAETVAETTVA
jgi:hypothetical protein